MTVGKIKTAEEYKLSEILKNRTYEDKPKEYTIKQLGNDELVCLILDHFHTNYTNLIYPAKSYYSSIMYAMFMSCLTDISPYELLSWHIHRDYKFLAEDYYFIPICFDLKSYKSTDNVTEFLLTYTKEDLDKAKYVYTKVFDVLTYKDIDINNGTNKYVLDYFIREFNIKEKINLQKLDRWW